VKKFVFWLIVLFPVVPSRAEETGRDGLTLVEAWSRMSASGPELKAIESELRILSARRDQAGLWPNPELSILVENAAGTGAYQGVDAAEFTVSVSQPVPLSGRRGIELELTDAEIETLRGKIILRKRQIAAELVSTFVEVLGHREHVEHARQAVVLVQRFAEAAAERTKAGAAPRSETLRAESILRDARLQLRRGELEYEASRIRLSSHWGGNSPDMQVAAIELSRLPASLPDIETLLSQVDKASIDPYWAKERSVREQGLRLEQSRGIPDLRVEAGYRHLNATHDHALIAGLSVPIPVANRNQGRIREMSEDIARIEPLRDLMRKEFGRTLTDAFYRLRFHHEEALLLRDELLPGSREALDLLMEGYRKGRFGIVDVTDAERRLYELLERYHDALVSFHHAAATIESLTSEPLYPGSITFIDLGEQKS